LTTYTSKLKRFSSYWRLDVLGCTGAQRSAGAVDLFGRPACARIICFPFWCASSPPSRDLASRARVLVRIPLARTVRPCPLTRTGRESGSSSTCAAAVTFASNPLPLSDPMGRLVKPAPWKVDASAEAVRFGRRKGSSSSSKGASGPGGEHPSPPTVPQTRNPCPQPHTPTYVLSTPSPKPSTLNPQP
jgi:hypothetical protein